MPRVTADALSRRRIIITAPPGDTHILVVRYACARLLLLLLTHFYLF